MYKPINGWTKESIIDHIIYNFKGKSVVVHSSAIYPDTGVESCKYRGPNGKKCAVGMFIPDELYHPNIEGSCIRSTKLININLLKSNFPLHIDAMEDLQEIHDVSDPDCTLTDLIDWVDKNVKG